MIGLTLPPCQANFLNGMSSSPSSDHFRRACSAFPTGVTVVTALDPQGAPYGMTANSFTSVSLDPPLILVCIDQQARMLEWLAAASPFAVNILRATQAHLSNRFARAAHDRFGDTPWSPGVHSAPLIDGVLGHFECRVQSLAEAGDHVIVLGEVLRCECHAGEPLVFFGGGYRGVTAS